MSELEYDDGGEYARCLHEAGKCDWYCLYCEEAMKDNDYIRKAVELADGWQIEAEKDGRTWVTGAKFSGTIGALTQPDLDALAARLVRQVYSHEVRPLKFLPYVNYALDSIDTIRDIVDSKVLDSD